MKKLLATLFLFSLTFNFSSVYAQQVKKLTSEQEKISYSIGLGIGNNLQQQGLDKNVIKIDAMMQGISDILHNNKLLLSEDDIKETMDRFKEQMIAKMEKEAMELGRKNAREGEDFLSKNKKMKNVKTLPSGLQYIVLKKGKGSQPGLNDRVVTHYKGTLIDGTVFDSSYDRKQPATFSVNEVIKGWTEALQLMHVGAKWKLFIPAHLAYGQRGAGRMIGPNSTLVFEIELLKVKKP